MTSNVDKELDTKKLVERFRICWEVWPEYMIVRGEKRQIGYALELSGTHEPGVEHPSPGCEHCVRVYDALQAIASHVIPKDRRLSRHDIGIYDHAIHYSRKRRERPEVSLTVQISHRTGFEQPVDECENKCLNEMKAHLRELGASEGRWVPAVAKQ